jgi:23S rRNA (cytosine1962-C5)-methyltransferase
VFGDGDGLSGLVIDRFNDTFVIQSGTAGMDAVLDDIAAALDHLYQPKNIVVKSESAVREQEGLGSMVQALKGELPAEVLLSENGVDYYAPLEEGQKTGWFYDHRAARRRILPLVAGARVLDVFSYCGAWGVLAAARGASSVTCVDSSARAIEFVQRNAELNGVAERMTTLAMEANAAMKELILQGQRFDVVIIDPPAFIKRKKDFKNGLAGYHAINELAMRLVEPGGILVSASCSMHLTRDQLMDVVRSSGRHIDRFVQVFATEGQAEDHPIHPAIPETEYLKSIFARVLMNP